MAIIDRPNRSLFRFVQVATPANPDMGDTWYQPGLQRAWQWNGTAWVVYRFVSDPMGYAGIAGYSAGGLNSGGSGQTTISKLDFRFEVIVPVVASLPTANGSSSGVSANTAGYYLGGTSGSGQVTTIKKLIFSTEAVSTITTGLNTARQSASSCHSSLAGYILGGNSGLTSSEKILFSSEVVTNLVAALPYAKSNTGSFQSPTNGYLMGGTGSTTAIIRLVFGADTVSTLTNTLPTGRTHQTGVCSYKAGYTISANGSAACDKLLFSTEVATTIASAATNSAYNSNGTGISSRIAGYKCGGTTATNSIAKLSFFNDTTSAVTSTLLLTVSDAGSVENLAK